MTPNWFIPVEGSWLRRFISGESRARPRPGVFLCGLRADAGAALGLADQWQYRPSTIDADELVFGKRRRVRLRLLAREPIEPWVEPRTGFEVWAARDLGSGIELEVAVERRDAHLLTDSSLAD